MPKDKELIVVECQGPVGYRVLIGYLHWKDENGVKITHATQYIPGDDSVSNQLLLPIFDALMMDEEVAANSIMTIPNNSVYSITLLPLNSKATIIDKFNIFWSIPSQEPSE